MTIPRFTDDQILDMRTRYRDGELQKTIAVDYGIRQSLMSMILDGRCYNNSPWPLPITSRQRKSFKEYPGYEFDDQGSAYSFKNSKIYGRLLKPHISDRGYAVVPVTVHGRQKRMRLNRIICTLFHGPPPTQEHHAMHLNGIKLDNRAVNLAWGTHQENEDAKVEHGTRPVGEKTASAKLTENEVMAIRMSDKSSRATAKEYGVSQVSIVRIRNYHAWKHVE